MNKPKFRAYVKSINKVLPVCELSFRDNDDLPIGVDGHEMWYRADEVILMQYTGQKDKNGVEIYEGDVCEWHIPDMGRPEPDAMIRYVSVAEYRKGSFNLSGYLFPNVRLIKVLGNIHANPELLNEVE